MIKHMLLNRSLWFLLSITYVANSAARAPMSGGLSSGVAWTARHTALFVNPAGLSSGDSQMSLYGIYGTETENITGALTGNSGAIGFGAGMIYDKASASSIYKGGVGFNLSALNAGVSMDKSGSGDPSFNAGATLDLAALRLAGVLKNLNSINEADVAVGFMSGPIRFEVGVFEAWPMSLKTGVAYSGLVYNSHSMSFSFGAHKSYVAGTLSGDITFGAGLEIAIGNSLAIQGEYNSLIESSKYTVGARLKF